VHRLAAIAAVVAAAATGCSDDDAGAPSASPETITVAPSTDGGNVTTATSSEAATSEAATSTEALGTPTTEPLGTDTIATVPEQRVPGLDSTDGFCRGWSEFAGSFQALAFASAVGTDGAAAARLEVVASGAVSAAAQLLGDEFPETIASERDVFLDQVIGPFTRRAARAGDELRTAGLSPGQIRQLADAWLSALADAGVDEPAVAVTVPDDLSGAVDAATAAFSSDVPPIVSDPSLVTDASAPATQAYLVENCSDQGILGGNDAID
jgi:hypothetical protein